MKHMLQCYLLLQSSYMPDVYSMNAAATETQSSSSQNAKCLILDTQFNIRARGLMWFSYPWLTNQRRRNCICHYLIMKK